MQRAEILTMVEEQFSEIRKRLDAHLERIGEIQFQVDRQLVRTGELQVQLDQIHDMVKRTIEG